jgi:hypothetical protein
MEINYTTLKAHVLSNLKLAQKNFNKNPNSTYWEVLTRAMLVHQQVSALQRDRNIGHLCERLNRISFGDWDEVIVKHALGLTIRDVLAPSVTNV